MPTMTGLINAPIKEKMVLLIGLRDAMTAPDLLHGSCLCNQAAMQFIVKHEVFDCIMTAATQF